VTRDIFLPSSHILTSSLRSIFTGVFFCDTGIHLNYDFETLSLFSLRGMQSRFMLDPDLDFDFHLGFNISVRHFFQFLFSPPHMFCNSWNRTAFSLCTHCALLAPAQSPIPSAFPPLYQQGLDMQSDASFYIQSGVINGLNYSMECNPEPSEAYTSYWLPALELSSIEGFYNDSDTCLLEVSDDATVSANQS